MALKTITSANAVYLLSIPALFGPPIALQGFSADAAFATDAVKPVETSMGIDGKMSAGFVFQMHKQKITIMPDSDSVAIFDAWANAQHTNRNPFFANATIEIPAIGKTYTLTKGALTQYKQIPDAKKVLAAHEYEITWEDISVAEV